MPWGAFALRTYSGESSGRLRSCIEASFFLASARTSRASASFMPFLGRMPARIGNRSGDAHSVTPETVLLHPKAARQTRGRPEFGRHPSPLVLIVSQSPERFGTRGRPSRATLGISHRSGWRNTTRIGDRRALARCGLRPPWRQWRRAVRSSPREHDRRFSMHCAMRCSFRTARRPRCKAT